MTKPREPQSFESAMTRILGLYGTERAAELLGKSDTLLRYWSDPDDDRLPTVKQALALDMAVKSECGETPLFSVYQAQLERKTFAYHPDLMTNALDCTVALGKFHESIRAALDPTGRGGHRITQDERRECEAHLDRLERQIHKARAALKAKCMPQLKEVS